MLSLLASNLDMTVESVELFGLALVRIATLVYILPFLGIQGVVPGTVKAGLSFFLAIIIYPQMPAAGFTVGNAPLFFFLLVLEQVMVGLVIGITASFIFHFVGIGGHLMSRDIGISMGGSEEPVTSDTADEVTVLIMLVLSAAFMVKGYHLYFIQVIIDSFRYIPLGHYNFGMLPVARVMCLLSAAALVTGVKLAAPVMVALLATSIGMGLMSRVMPSMNVWIVAVPLKVFLAIWIIWQVFPLMSMLFDSNFRVVQEGIAVLLNSGGIHGG